MVLVHVDVSVEFWIFLKVAGDFKQSEVEVVLLAEGGDHFAFDGGQTGHPGPQG